MHLHRTTDPDLQEARKQYEIRPMYVSTFDYRESPLGILNLHKELPRARLLASWLVDNRREPTVAI
jgi:hypothetical protein